MNWLCPIDQTIWRNPVAAMSHLYNSTGPQFGQKREIPTSDQRPIFPQPTEKTPTQDSLEGLSPRMRSKVEQIEDMGLETPSILSQSDIRTMNLIDHYAGFQDDLDHLREEIGRIDAVLSKTISNWNQLTEETKIETTPEVDEETTTETNQGSLTTEEAREREEDLVIDLLEKSSFFDEQNDLCLEIFEIIFEQRDDEIRFEEIRDDLNGLPPKLLRDQITILDEEFNIIEWDRSDDTVFYQMPVKP